MARPDQLTHPDQVLSTAGAAACTHLVLFPFPAHGHMIPLMQLGNVLALKGLIITFVCAEHRLSLMQEADCRGHYHPNLRIVTLPDSVPLGEHGVDEGVDSVNWSINGTTKMIHPFRDLMSSLMQRSSSDANSNGRYSRRSCSSTSPVGIISDYALSWTQDIANEFAIPRYVFFPSAASGLLFMFYVPTLVAQGHLPLISQSLDKGATAKKDQEMSYINVPGLPPVRRADVSSAWQATSQQWLQRFSLRNAERLHEAAGVLLNSFNSLEENSITALRSNLLINPRMVSVHTVGPLLPSAFFDKPTFFCSSPQAHHNALIRSWLDNQPPSSVLYISFGSIVLPSLRQIQELAYGLEASKQGFVWVLRPPASAISTPHPSLEENYSLSSLLPEGFQLRTQKQGLIISDWAPQLLILSHPATAAFLTHCGWNSILECVSRGLPMLGLPFFADQMMNSRMLVDQVRIAVEIPKGSGGIAMRNEVRKAVRVMMGGSAASKDMRQRAQELRDAAKQAIIDEKNGSSRHNLNDFIHEIRKRCSC